MTIKNITVLGSGVMGHGIAQVSATAGYNVVLRDIEQEFLDKAMKKVNLNEEKGLIKGSAVNFYGENITAEEVDAFYAEKKSPNP